MSDASPSGEVAPLPEPEAEEPSTGAFAPLRIAEFRNIWSGTLMANLGHMVLGVAAAWEMTRLSGSAAMVAMVQTALLLPLMVVNLPAGALADMFDRRKIALSGLAIAVGFGTLLVLISWLGLVTPWLLLAFMTLIGSGVALYGPSWASSISEMVPPQQLPAGVALGSVSHNLARSLGPAIGGILVVAAGATVAYGANALAYLPLVIAFLFWKRPKVSSRLPPESFSRALVSGFRFARHASGVRNAIARGFIFGLAGAGAGALAPLIARDLLGEGAGVYGILLGASGLGAVAGSLATSAIREKIGPERAVRYASLLCATALLGVGFSRWTSLTTAFFALQGATTLLVISMLNVGLQLSTPRWVMARALSIFSSAITGGLAVGALVVGLVANAIGVEFAMYASGVAMALTVLVGIGLPLRRESPAERTPAEIGNEVEVTLAINDRSGPIVIEIDYRIAVEDAREFYQSMQKIAISRRRNGAFDWSITRDIADPELWTERYHCPTWGDYLHMRDRYTQADHELQRKVEEMSTLEGLGRVRRKLERPYGSVRWRDDTPETPHPGPDVYSG